MIVIPHHDTDLLQLQIVSILVVTKIPAFIDYH
jgi:hypothetical protein